MLTKYLYIAGCIPFIALGILHTVYTIADIYNPKRLIPYKSEVMGLMKESILVITKETNMWRAWVGFNISHMRRHAVFLRHLFIFINSLHVLPAKLSIFHERCTHHFTNISRTV